MTSNKQTKLARPTKPVSEASQAKKKANLKYSYNRNKDKGPKRNKSAFVIFSNQTRIKLKEEGHEYANANDMMIKLAGMWKNLSKEEKKPYEEEARNDKFRYYQELESYWKENPSRTLTNKTKNNHVKKPCSAYGLFLKDVKDDVKAQNPSVKMAEIMKIVSSRWKALDKVTRAMYQEKAKKEKEEAKKRLSEHYSRNENGEEECLKKRLEKWSWIKRKMKDLPAAKNSYQENLECELKLESLETSSDYNSSAQNDNLMVKMQDSSDLGMASDLEQINQINNYPATMESSIVRTESIPNPKEEFDTVKVENLPEIVEKDFIAAMLSFDCGIEIKDHDIDFSLDRGVKVESSPFVQALELEIPGLDCAASRALFNRTIQNILDYDNSEGWETIRNINSFANTSSRKLSWTQY